MAIDSKDDSEKQAEWHPEPAESFSIEYLNTRIDITHALQDINFSEQGRSYLDENTVVVRAENRNDGTTIEMTIRKGDRYKSPKELAAERIKPATGGVVKAAGGVHSEGGGDDANLAERLRLGEKKIILLDALKALDRQAFNSQLDVLCRKPINISSLISGLSEYVLGVLDTVEKSKEIILPHKRKIRLWIAQEVGERLQGDEISGKDRSTLYEAIIRDIRETVLES